MSVYLAIHFFSSSFFYLFVIGCYCMFVRSYIPPMIKIQITQYRRYIHCTCAAKFNAEFSAAAAEGHLTAQLSMSSFT